MKKNEDEEYQSLNIKNNKVKQKNKKKLKMNKDNNIQASNIKLEKVIRNSSFELLRFILMMFIVLSHILFHTKSLPKLDEKNYKTIINNNYILLRIISNYGKLADITFCMISGYFSIKRLNFHYIKFILIASQIYFYHYLFYYLSFKLKNIYPDIYLLSQKIGSVYFPLTTSLGHWFAQHYLLLLIFMPFINTGLLSLSHEQYKTLVILIIIFYCILRSFFNVFKIENSVFAATQLIKIMLPYFIGGYIRLFDLNNPLFWKILGFICFLLTIIFEFVYEKAAIYYNNYIYILLQNEISLNINSLLLFFCSIGLICMFKDIIIYNKTINFISASVLGVYLIHANKNIAPFIYNGWFKTNDYNQEYFFIKYFTKAFIIFFISLIIDIIRRYTVGVVIKYILFYFINIFKEK